jgi:transposase
VTARYLIGAGVDCVVAGPSKLERASGDRVKTDARHARHLARLLHLGEIVHELWLRRQRFGSVDCAVAA